MNDFMDYFMDRVTDEMPSKFARCSVSLLHCTALSALNGTELKTTFNINKPQLVPHRVHPTAAARS